MGTSSTRSELGACGRHPERRATARCVDCSAPICAACTLSAPPFGTFCPECAVRRGGVRPGRTPVHVPTEASAPAGADVPMWPALAAQRFEQMVGDRPDRPLISGLTERLRGAGADPTDVVDDQGLLEDIGRLHDLASAAPERGRGRRTR